MKLTKRLTVNGIPFQLNTDEVQFNLHSPGRAAFGVSSTEKISGLVVFSIGYDPDNLHSFFVGVVETCFQVDKKQQRIFCRELTSVLNQILPLSIRNASLNDVLAEISKKNGLSFVTPDQPYATKKTPAFMSVGGGYHCMDVLARVFRIPQMIWQQQGDGKVYVGSWEHSYWSKGELDLPVEYQASSGISNRAEIPAAPSLRPGVKLSSGHIVTSLSLSETRMNIGWEANPWGNEWTNKSTV